MDRNCIAIEELEQLTQAPPGDPRRMHARSCPRCASRLASLQLFGDSQSPAAGADPDEAELRLRRFVDQLGGRRRRIPRRRLTWGLVAAAAAVVLLLSWPAQDPGLQPSHVLRGGGAASAALSSGQALWTEDGVLQLSWEDPMQTVASQVVFVTLDLHEVARVPADGPGRLELDAASVPGALAQGQALLWSVVCDQDGEDHAITASALLER